MVSRFLHAFQSFVEPFLRLLRLDRRLPPPLPVHQAGVEGETTFKCLVALATVSAEGIQIGSARVETGQLCLRVQDALRLAPRSLVRILSASQIAESLPLSVPHQRRVLRVVHVHTHNELALSGVHANDVQLLQSAHVLELIDGPDAASRHGGESSTVS